jgi:hypothetical protein
MRRDAALRSQPSLFDVPVAQPIVRKSDPPTSQQAAAKIQQDLPRSHFLFMCVLREAVAPLTANEVADIAAKAFAEVRSETIRKRAKELENEKLIKVVGERKCNITGYMALTYWPA